MLKTLNQKWDKQVKVKGVKRDLPALEEQGTLLVEDKRGLLSLFRQRR